MGRTSFLPLTRVTEATEDGGECGGGGFRKAKQLSSHSKKIQPKTQRKIQRKKTYENEVVMIQFASWYTCT